MNHKIQKNIVLYFGMFLILVGLYTHCHKSNNYINSETTEKETLYQLLLEDRERALECFEKDNEYDKIESCIKEGCLKEFGGYYSCLEDLECTECMNECIKNNKNILKIHQITPKLRWSL